MENQNDKKFKDFLYYFGGLVIILHALFMDDGDPTKITPSRSNSVADMSVNTNVDDTTHLKSVTEPKAQPANRFIQATNNRPDQHNTYSNKGM
jgi:hypothetical protein